MPKKAENRHFCGWQCENVDTMERNKLPTTSQYETTKHQMLLPVLKVIHLQK